MAEVVEDDGAERVDEASTPRDEQQVDGEVGDPGARHPPEIGEAERRRVGGLSEAQVRGQLPMTSAAGRDRQRVLRRVEDGLPPVLAGAQVGGDRRDHHHRDRRPDPPHEQHRAHERGRHHDALRVVTTTLNQRQELENDQQRGRHRECGRLLEVVASRHAPRRRPRPARPSPDARWRTRRRWTVVSRRSEKGAADLIDGGGPRACAITLLSAALRRDLSATDSLAEIRRFSPLCTARAGRGRPRAAAIRLFTTSPIDTRPTSSSPSSTGMCRTRRSVIVSAMRSTSSSGAAGARPTTS